MMAGPDLSFDQQQQRDAFFERAVHQHSTLLYRVAYAVTRHPADAEDAVADALLKLLRTGAWEGVRNERAFLARTVWRSALDRLAARSPGHTFSLDEMPLYDGQPTPELRAMAAERWAMLHHLIDALPLDLREPLLLSSVDELNSREIGDAMHLPEGTVRTRLMRARATLREQFETQQRRDAGREVTSRGPSQ